MHRVILLTLYCFAVFTSAVLGSTAFGNESGHHPELDCPCTFTMDSSSATTIEAGVTNIDSATAALGIRVLVHDHKHVADSEFSVLAKADVVTAPDTASAIEQQTFNAELFDVPEGSYYLTFVLTQGDTVIDTWGTETPIMYDEGNSEFSVTSFDYLMDTDGDGVGDVNERLMGMDETDATSTPGGSVIDLLFLYSPGVTELYNGDPGTRFDHLISYANTIMADSKVALEFRLAGVQELAMTQGQDAEQWLNDVDNREGVFADMDSLRDQYKADLIVILQPDDGVTDTCGIANLGGYLSRGDFSANGNISLGHTVMYVDCPGDTMVHEIGHLMGLGHSFRQGDSGTFHWARGYGVDNSFATVMAYESAFHAPQVPFMSNPSMQCEGMPCGTAIDQPQASHAVHSLNATRFQIANFRIAGNELIADTAHPADTAELVHSDFNGDGRPDLMLRHADGSWRLYLMDGSTVLSEHTVAATSDLAWSPISFEDFNGDGNADILIRHHDGRWWLYTMDGATILAQSSVKANRNPDWVPVSIQDTNNDGKADILLRNRTVGSWWHYGMDGAEIVLSRGVGASRDQSWEPVSYADFNNDGRGDILLRNSEYGGWWLYTLNGSDIQSGNAVRMSSNRDWQPVSFADFNGDGYADVLLRNTTTHGWWLYSLQGSTVTAGARVGASGNSEWQPVSFADFNGDGNADILLRRTTNGDWWLYTMNGSAVNSTGRVNGDRNTDWQPAGLQDFNGDGSADILLRHSVTGAWKLHTLDGQTITSSTSAPLTSDSGWRLVTPQPDPNKAPITGELISHQILTAGGDSIMVDATQHFSDPAGDPLTYQVSSSNTDVATVSVSPEGTVTVVPVTRGEAEITITASDPDGLMTEQTFKVTVETGAVDSGWVYGVFDPSRNFEAFCARPRVGNFPDEPGTVTDENNWLRSKSNEIYLWYEEIVDVDPRTIQNPLDYFELMRTFALTPSGNFKDQFHFTYDTEEYIKLAQGGIAVGYGATFVLLSRSPPRQVVVAYTEPDSSATSAAVNLARGAEILEIDGALVVNGNPDVLNRGLSPSSAGESHTFVIRDQGATVSRTVTMVSQEVTSTPVQNVGTIDTATGKVGYMLFNDHIATAEGQLVNAVNMLKTESITDLVLDLRYNGGGFLYIANELAYMIAGQVAAGQIFEELQFNDKHTAFNPVTGAPLSPTYFRRTTRGNASLAAGFALPTLDLSRVFVLTGGGTCSASEAIINGLTGIGIEVIQIGNSTCGKPYGFYALDNCGTAYFTIQFRGVNAQGFGDYADGFFPSANDDDREDTLPGCVVSDDFTHSLGDAMEARLSSALHYRENGSCPSSPGARLLSRPDGEVVKPVWLDNRTAIR